LAENDSIKTIDHQHNVMYKVSQSGTRIFCRVVETSVLVIVQQADVIVQPRLLYMLVVSHTVYL